MKRELVKFLNEKGYTVFDCGPNQYDHDDDYPDYISKVAFAVSEEKDSRGIVVGWSGQGEAIVSNRFQGVRCALYYGGTKHIITLSREHNDSNILSLGAHFITNTEAKDAVLLWLETSFSDEERHIRRIKKIEEIF